MTEPVAEDHAAGLASSLTKLAAYLVRRITARSGTWWEACRRAHVMRMSLVCKVKLLLNTDILQYVSIGYLYTVEKAACE